MTLPGKTHATPKPWTTAEKDLLARMEAAGFTWKDIAQRTGHPKSSCQTTMSYIRRGRARNGYVVTPRQPAPVFVAPPVQAVPPPSSRQRHTSILIADAELRSRIETLGPTGGLLGDPLPGRSALDQKRGVTT